jgi:hypothetical protein
MAKSVTVQGFDLGPRNLLLSYINISRYKKHRMTHFFFTSVVQKPWVPGNYHPYFNHAGGSTILIKVDFPSFSVRFIDKQPEINHHGIYDALARLQTVNRSYNKIITA